MRDPKKLWILYFQDPECYDEQGIFFSLDGVTHRKDRLPEFDAINDPAKSKIVVRDLWSAQAWAKDVFCLDGEVVGICKL